MAPNAVGACLNPQTIPNIKAPIVCGAANNQLVEARRDGRALAARNILYVPDFLGNRMGIVNCANEQYGVFEGDDAIMAHLEKETPSGIFQRCLEVFRRAEASGRSTAEEAGELAEELAEEGHPIWPDRGQRIINHLVKAGWDRALTDPLS
jgi:glutamate dehydrogenase/leucine dehydrogenase